MGASVFIARWTRGSCSSTSNWLTMPAETLSALPYGAPTTTTSSPTSTWSSDATGATASGSPSTARSARSSSGTLPSWTMRARTRWSLGRSTTTWNEAPPERPSRCTTCWLVRTYYVSPSTATTTPLAARSSFPRTSTSTRTLSRSAFCTTLLLSLLARAGRASRARATAVVRKVNVPPFEMPSNQQYKHGLRFQTLPQELGEVVGQFLCYACIVFQRIGSTLTIVVGFFLGLVLASLDHILPAASIQEGPARWLVDFVDWVAPPLAGVLIAGALLYAQRARMLHAAEKAAAEVLRERLAGTERRQAIWVVAAAVAHDLKNPLHNLQLLVEEVSDENDPDRRAELLRRIHENVARATERLSELSRAGQNPRERIEQRIDVAS